MWVTTHLCFPEHERTASAATTVRGPRDTHNECRKRLTQYDVRREEGREGSIASRSAAETVEREIQVRTITAPLSDPGARI